MRKILLPIIYALPLIIIPLLLSGCGAIEQNNSDALEWWHEETGTYRHRHPELEAKKLNSNNPKDYLLPNGYAYAIPGRKDWDLYISPYAPDRYFRCRQAPGTLIIDPYTGKILILSDRKKIADKEIPD